MIIEVREIYKSFGTNAVLRGSSLQIDAGEAIVIIGRSGGGKSILLKHLIGLCGRTTAGCWSAASILLD